VGRRLRTATWQIIKLVDAARWPACQRPAMVDVMGTFVLALVVAALVFIFAPRPS
jgi:hypothetical protein